MDQNEFADRVERLRERLYRTALLYLGSEADALEAVDEAVYQALRALKKLRQTEFFNTWITRILLNECHKELRRRKRFLPHGEEALPETAGADAYDGLPLKDAVCRLPEPLRAIVILRLFCRLFPGRRQPPPWNCPRGLWPPGRGGRCSCCGWNWERRRRNEAKGRISGTAEGAGANAGSAGEHGAKSGEAQERPAEKKAPSWDPRQEAWRRASWGLCCW